MLFRSNSDKIKLNGVSSIFKAVMTFDKGLDIPENPKLTLTDNNLFEIKKIEKSGQSVTVTMALKKNYSKFSELYKDVTEVPDDLDLNIVLDEPGLVQLQAMKTGALLSCPLSGTALLFGAAPELVDQMARFGALLGRAFQIQDDLLDVTANPEALGKTVGKEQRDRKSVV